jgi:hypothetical protein
LKKLEPAEISFSNLFFFLPLSLTRERIRVGISSSQPRIWQCDDAAPVNFRVGTKSAVEFWWNDKMAENARSLPLAYPQPVFIRVTSDRFRIVRRARPRAADAGTSDAAEPGFAAALSARQADSASACATFK